MHEHPFPPKRRVRPWTDQRGFTMVELLVVILIVGILAVIALPAFFNQRTKGQDTVAKEMLHTATTAIATYHVDEDTFDADVAKLVALEPSLANASAFTVTGTKSTYELSVASASGTTFSVARDAGEAVTNTCSAHGTGMCRDHADPRGNWW
jgi:type IV pilus assembly protein PilA